MRDRGFWPSLNKPISFLVLVAFVLKTEIPEFVEINSSDGQGRGITPWQAIKKSTRFKEMLQVTGDCGKTF